jgi:uncharacterized membrane protein YtjA (UPF0391 family)
MRSAALVALIAVLVAGSLGVGYLSGTSAGGTRTVTSTAIFVSTTTTQVTVTAQGSSTTSSAMNTTCVAAVPPPQGIYLKVVTDGGTPVSGLNVTSQYEVNASCDRNEATLTSSFAVTNSSGWMLFQAGYPWYFVFSYSGHTYNFTVNSDPVAWTLATIALPSGSLATQICGLGGGNPTTYCQPTVTTTVRPTK